jgi:hypothetical protein
MAARTASPPVVTEEKWTYERYLRETAEGEYFTIIMGEKIVSGFTCAVKDIFVE